jgi:hypothetical protein
MPKKKKIEEICGNCLLFDCIKDQCKIAVLVNGQEVHMPVQPKDKCHFDELGIKVEQVRWWVEDEKGKPTQGTGTVKIEYPEGFFGDSK